MNNAAPTHSLPSAVDAWKAAAQATVLARASYLRAFAAALSATDAKNAETRKADADVRSIDERIAYEMAQIEERSARWAVEAILGHGSSFAEAA